jgi:hypothetical protein
MMWLIDDEIPRPPLDPPEPEQQQWACGPFGFWPLTFPWSDGVSWGMWQL